MTAIIDGDTVSLSGVGRVRLIGVDTPEVFTPAECYGAEALAYAKHMLPGGRRVHYSLGMQTRDRYGRALAYVWTRDGRLVNALLVEGGFARPFLVEPNTRYARRPAAAGERARNARRGLWRRCR